MSPTHQKSYRLFVSPQTFKIFFLFIMDDKKVFQVTGITSQLLHRSRLTTHYRHPFWSECPLTSIKVFGNLPVLTKVQCRLSKKKKTFLRTSPNVRTSLQWTELTRRGPKSWHKVNPYCSHWAKDSSWKCRSKMD